METIKEVLQVFARLLSWLVVMTFQHPETAPLTAIPLICIALFLNSFVLKSLLCPKFDPVFRKYLENERYANFTLFPPTLMRATYYALMICVPSLYGKLAPKMVGYDFRGRVGGGTVALCWVQTGFYFYAAVILPLSILYFAIAGVS